MVSISLSIIAILVSVAVAIYFYKRQSTDRNTEKAEAQIIKMIDEIATLREKVRVLESKLAEVETTANYARKHSHEHDLFGKSV